MLNSFARTNVATHFSIHGLDIRAARHMATHPGSKQCTEPLVLLSSPTPDTLALIHQQVDLATFLVANDQLLRNVLEIEAVRNKIHWRFSFGRLA